MMLRAIGSLPANDFDRFEGCRRTGLGPRESERSNGPRFTSRRFALGDYGMRCLEPGPVKGRRAWPASTLTMAYDLSAANTSL